MSASVCKQHVIALPPPKFGIRRFKAFRQHCSAFVDSAELKFYRETAVLRTFKPKRDKIHCVWDFSYGCDLPERARSRHVLPNAGYILVTLQKSDLAAAYWILYKREQVDRQNPQYVLSRVGSLQIYNNVLSTIVTFSNLPYSDRMCASCLMDQFE